MGTSDNTTDNKPTILIVDDEVAVTNSLARSLRDQFHILTANNAKQALNILENQEAAVILTDQRMPDMNGITLLERAKVVRPDSLGVIITGYTDISVLIDALNLGTARGYLPKPWNIEILRQTLSSVSRQYQAVITDRSLLSTTSENLMSVRKDLQDLRAVLDRFTEGQLDALFQSPEAASQLHLNNGQLSFTVNRKYIDNLSDGLAILDPHGILEYCNIGFLRLLDLETWQEKYNLPLQEAPHLNQILPLINTLDIVHRGEYILADCKLINTQGEIRHIEITATPVLVGEDQYKAVLVARDQTTKQQAINHLTCLNEIANATNQHTRLEEVLPPALEISNHALSTDGYLILQIDQNTNQIFSTFHSLPLEESVQKLTQNLQMQDSLIKSLLSSPSANAHTLMPKNQSYFNQWALHHGMVSLAYAPIEASDKSIGLLLFYSCQPRKFTQAELNLLKAIASQINLGLVNASLHTMVLAQAQTDALTGIMNRRYFMEILALEHERSRTARTPLTIMMLDMDNFKAVNDNFGHQKGDEVLKQIGKKLIKTTRPEDYVARYGGDEFIILLTDTDLPAGLLVAERIEQAIAQISAPTKELADTPLRISIGTASLMHDPPETMDSLISRADARLYNEKNQKSNVQIGQ